MGLDPGFGDYKEGDECPACVDILFGGVTPKYVELDLVDLVKCPIWPWAAPNGTWLLTQAGPCRWILFSDPYFFSWQFLLGVSILDVNLAPGIQWFYKEVNDTCIDAFVNSLVVCTGNELSILGYGLLWWGPTIGP